MWRMSFLDMALAHSAQWSQILDGFRIVFKHFSNCGTFWSYYFYEKITRFDKEFFTIDFGNFSKKN